MKILLTDRAGLTAYLRFPAEHHHRIRHSNFIERTFGEIRRRAKVIGRFPGETSCISIVWAVLDRASRGWRGLTMTPAGLRQLQHLRRSLLETAPPASVTHRHRQPARRRRRKCQHRRLTSATKPKLRPAGRPTPEPGGRWRSGSGSKRRKGAGWPHSS